MFVPKLLPYRFFIRYFWRLLPYEMSFQPFRYGQSFLTQFSVHFHPRYYVRSYRKLALARSLTISDVPETLGGIFANHYAQPLRVTQTAGSPPARYSLVKILRTCLFFYLDILLRLYTYNYTMQDYLF